MLEIEATHGLIAKRITLFQNNCIIAFKKRHKINRNLLDIVDFTTCQRIRSGLSIGHRDPTHLIDVDDLTACHPAGWLAARYVIFVLYVGHADARLELGGYELEWSRTDMFGYCSIGRCRSDTRWHNKWW